MNGNWFNMKRKSGFSRDERGTTVVFFAFAIVPLLALVGGIVDYGRASTVKSELVAALDGAVLAATQAYSLDNTVDVEKVVNDFMDKNYSKSGKKILSSHLAVNAPTIGEEGELTAKLDVEVASGFLQLVGIDSFDYSVVSSARVGGQSLEVALVLDNTLSMKGAKIASLKTSAQDLVDTLMDDSGKVKMAVVPFADYVNIGTEHRDLPGLDIPAAYSIDKGESCDKNETTTKCDYDKVEYECTNDGVPGICTKSVNPHNCVTTDNPNYGKCWQNKANYDWYGCMASRPHDLNVRDDGYDVGVPGLMTTSNSCKVAKMTRLTTTKATIDAALTAMKAQGITYIPSGLAWGWRAISDSAVFGDGVPYSDDKVKKAIVLMTDGDNTLVRVKGSGDSVKDHAGEVWQHSKYVGAGNAPESDTFTAELCANIKAQGIMVHTIAFEVADGSPVETLMKNCAGNGGQYYDADDSEELSAAFKKISLALLNLRLSK